MADSYAHWLNLLDGESFATLRVEARIAAADWHGGQSSALYAFASTGTVLPSLQSEVKRCGPDVDDDSWHTLDVLDRFCDRVAGSIFPAVLLNGGTFYRESGPRALRALLDESADAVRRPGRYCDRMAFVISECVAPDGVGDRYVSTGNDGSYAERYGRYVLYVDAQGFCSTEHYRRVADAEAALDIAEIESEE